MSCRLEVCATTDMFLFGDWILDDEFAEPGYEMAMYRIVFKIKHIPFVSCNELVKSGMVCADRTVSFLFVES